MQWRKLIGGWISDKTASNIFSGFSPVVIMGFRFLYVLWRIAADLWFYFIGCRTSTVLGARVSTKYTKLPTSSRVIQRWINNKRSLISDSGIFPIKKKTADFWLSCVDIGGSTMVISDLLPTFFRVFQLRKRIGWMKLRRNGKNFHFSHLFHYKRRRDCRCTVTDVQ